jgi:hypothetical protein
VDWRDIVSRRMIVALIFGSILSILSAAPTAAGPGRTTPDVSDSSIIPTAGVESFGPGSGGGGSGPRCSWARYEGGMGMDGDSNGAVLIPGTREGPQGTEVLYLKVCPGEAGGVPVYVPPVDVAAVRGVALRSVERQLPLPVLNMTPEPGSGGLIRMQNWLAVEPVAAVSATAAVGPVWVTMTASQDSLLWEFGDGGSETCEGTGSPLPEGVDNMLADEVNGAAECGYTFEHVSAPQFGATADLAFENSVTTAWAISWVDYTGAAGTLADLERVAEWSFQVRQIQTQRVYGDD